MITTIQSNIFIAYIIIAIFGLIVGSFLTVVISRYPTMLQQQWQDECREFLNLKEDEPPTKVSLALPGSFCPMCKTPIKFYHNIPVLSYLWLRGKCAHCKRHISALYPSIELLTAITSLVVFWRFGLTDEMLAALFLTYMLIALTFIDFKHQILPDTMTLSALWIGLLFNTMGLYTQLVNAVWGAVIGYLLLWISAWIFLKLRKKQGMGNGDFKMMAMVGAWLGLNMMINTLLIAVIVGALTSVVLIFFKKISWQRAVPFGPFIALAAWITLLCGPFIIQWIQ